MSLREWVLNLLGEFGSLWIHCKTIKKIENEEDYLQLFGSWREDIAFTCNVYNNGVSCFLFYDCGDLLTVRVDWISARIWGGALIKVSDYGADWKQEVVENYAELLEKCNGCSCYNDYVVTGRCTGKAEGLVLWYGESL